MSPTTSPGAPNAVRGIVIVVVAGVLGLVLLARGGTNSLFDDGEPVAANTHVTSTTGNVPTIAPAPTTVAAPTDTKAPADVKVAVFNATAGAITGAAGDAQSKLTPLGCVVSPMTAFRDGSDWGGALATLGPGYRRDAA